MDDVKIWDLLPRSRGECPDSETLLHFHQNSLQETVGRDVAQHVLACGLCSNALSLLSEADALVHTGAEIEGWEALDKRGRKSFATYLAESSPVQPKVSWQPAYAAWALVLALLFPAYLGFRQLFSIRDNEPSIAAQVVRMGSSVRGADQSGAVELVDKDQPIVLLFFVPEKESDRVRYDGRVTDQTGKVVHSVSSLRSFDGLGNFLLVFAPGKLDSGAHELTVVERPSTSGEGRTWRYLFRVR